jgi:nicotinamidase-related amidase
MTKRAIIVVDLQNEYLSSGKLPLVGIERAVSNAARVIDSARTRSDLLIHGRRAVLRCRFGKRGDHPGRFSQ